MKTIEELIEQNHNLFDSEEPDKGHFERFDKKLIKQRNRSIIRMVIPQIAGVAAACVIAVLVLNQYITNTTEVISHSASISNEFRETELYYQTIYERSMDELEKMACRSTDFRKDAVLQDVEELNAIYSELKSELEKNPDDERIRQALITNYENKINLLNLVISEIKQNC